VGLQYQET